MAMLAQGRYGYAGITSLRDIIQPAAPVPAEGAHKRWTTRCIRVALRADQMILGMSLSGDEHRHAPAVQRERETAADLAWLSRMMEILATGGGDLLSAARPAHDEHLGHPRRRRVPVEAGWLAGEIDAALTAAWAALRDARHGGLPLWRAWPPPAARPMARADDGFFDQGGGDDMSFGPGAPGGIPTGIFGRGGPGGPGGIPTGIPTLGQFGKAGGSSPWLPAAGR